MKRCTRYSQKCAVKKFKRWQSLSSQLELVSFSKCYESSQGYCVKHAILLTQLYFKTDKIRILPNISRIYSKEKSREEKYSCWITRCYYFFYSIKVLVPAVPTHTPFSRRTVKNRKSAWCSRNWATLYECVFISCSLHFSVSTRSLVVVFFAAFIFRCRWPLRELWIT